MWRYTILESQKEEYEFEYGNERGSWSLLFNNSPDYLGSYLHRNLEAQTTYLLIDTWKSKESYEDFKRVYREDYNSLSTQFEKLYATEEKIGEFITSGKS